MRQISFSIKTLFVGILLLISPINMLSQQTQNSLTGSVTDANGAVIAGARVELINAQQANLVLLGI
jgi:hypothetical protein